MTGPATPDLPLLVAADLRLDVDGVQAQVSGDGQRVEIVTDHPVRLLVNAARTSSSRGALATVADTLAASGLTVELSGNHGPVGRIGREVDSHIGKLAVGTSHVRLVVDRRWTVAAAAASAVLVSLAVRGLRR